MTTPLGPVTVTTAPETGSSSLITPVITLWPVRARETRMVWAPASTSSTACTTSCGWVAVVGASRLVHAATIRLAAAETQHHARLMSIRSPAHRQPDRRKNRELREGDARRGCVGVVECV